MSLVKLESMCPSFTEFADFLHVFLPKLLSLNQFEMPSSLKQHEYERNWEMSSKFVSPRLNAETHISKTSKLSSTVSKPDDAESSSKIINSCLVLSDERIHCPPDINSYFYGKLSKMYFLWREKYDTLGDEFFQIPGVIHRARNLISDTASFLSNVASKADVQKDYALEESNDLNLPLKVGGIKHESEVIRSLELGSCEFSTEACNVQISSNLEQEKTDMSGALYCLLKETCKSDNDFLQASMFVDESSDTASSQCNSLNSDITDDDNSSEEADFALKEETDPRGSTITASNFCSSGKMSSECISSNSDWHKDHCSEEADSPLKEEIEEHKIITVSDSCSGGKMSSKCISSYSEVNKNDYSEEEDSSLKEEIEPHGSTITESYFCSSTVISSNCISSHSDVRKDQYSEEAYSSLKEETDPEKSTTTAFYSSIKIPKKCILSNLGRQFVISGESFKTINLIEFAYHLRENENPREKISSENSEEVEFYFLDQYDFENAKLLQNQFLYAKKSATYSNVKQVEEFSESENSNNQKNSEDYCETSIFGEAKKLLTSEFLDYLQETVEQICPTAEVTYSNLQEESELLEHPQSIRVQETGDDSNLKINISAEKTKKYNDLVQKILFLVYDFIFYIEGNAAFCMEKPNLISESLVEIGDCVKSVRILLYFLDNIKTDLESKIDEARNLKLDVEDMRELYSYEIKNTKEGKELQKSANKYVAEYKKAYAGIEKDLADCEWHYKNLESILDFYHNKCFFSSHDL